MSLKFNSVSKEFLEAIKDNPKKGTSPYDTVADVVRIEGNTAWVHIAGGVDETPVLRTIDCKEGDVVQIRVGGGTAWITGNSTAPPTDDTKANVAYNYAEIAIADALKARESAENAERDAERAYVAANSAEEQAQRAQTAADNAQDSADEATRQAGIATTNANEAIRQAGVATTNANEAIRQAGIAKTSADNAMASAISANNSANNALTQLSTVEDVVDVLTWISEHGTYKVSTDTEVVAGKFYFTRTGSGTTADPYVYTVVANPTGNPSTSGYYELDSVDEAISNYVSTHLALTDEGLFLVKDGSGYKLKLTDYGEYIVAPNGTVVNQMTADGNIIRATNGTVIAHLGYGEGASESGTATAPYYTFGTRVSSVAFGNYSVVEGKSNDATASCAHAEGSFTEASGANSHAEGYTTSAYGYSSHAEGYETEANHYSHAEGIRTEASGLRGCHAEGQETESSGEASHSEGYQTVASAFSSHAEGNGTEASGANSHAEGTTTVASEIASHAEGGYTQANGRYSHAQNLGTIANGDYQTALGQYNIADTTNAVIIGNGSNDSNRSNALTVDWDGIVQASGVIAYGVCDTAGATASKVVTVSHNGFKLVTGSQVLIKFKNANTVASPTLNVNGTGAKAIRRYGSTAPSTSAASSWNSGSVILLIYDGTNWQMVGFLNTTYSTITDAEYQAGTSTSSRLITPARLKSAILYHATPTNTGAMPSDYFIWDTYSKSITVTGSGAYNFTMGTLTQHSGYTLRGYINQNGGYTDQWLVSYGTYGSNVVAMVYSKYVASLTSTISCTAIWTKDL